MNCIYFVLRQHFLFSINYIFYISRPIFVYLFNRNVLIVLVLIDNNNPGCLMLVMELNMKCITSFINSLHCLCIITYLLFTLIGWIVQSVMKSSGLWLAVVLCTGSSEADWECGEQRDVPTTHHLQRLESSEVTHSLQSILSLNVLHVFSFYIFSLFHQVSFLDL